MEVGIDTHHFFNRASILKSAELIEKSGFQTSLAVQQLRLRTSTAGGVGLITGQERCHMAQPKNTPKIWISISSWTIRRSYTIRPESLMHQSSQVTWRGTLFSCLALFVFDPPIVYLIVTIDCFKRNSQQSCDPTGSFTIWLCHTVQSESLRFHYFILFHVCHRANMTTARHNHSFLSYNQKFTFKTYYVVKRHSRVSSDSSHETLPISQPGQPTSPTEPAHQAFKLLSLTLCPCIPTPQPTAQTADPNLWVNPF